MSDHHVGTFVLLGFLYQEIYQQMEVHLLLVDQTEQQALQQPFFELQFELVSVAHRMQFGQSEITDSCCHYEYVRREAMMTVALLVKCSRSNRQGALGKLPEMTHDNLSCVTNGQMLRS